MASYKYTLYYFDARGRGEVARWLFAQAGVPYEDVRLGGEKWKAKKSEMPFGQMPVLEVTDNTGKKHLIPQSRTIERFLAKQFGLDGKNDFDVAKADYLNEYASDLFQKIKFGDDEDSKKKRQEFFDGAALEGLANFEKFIEDGGYFLGNQVSYVDIAFSVFAEMLINMSQNPALLDKTPKLKKLHASVQALPKIAEWISKRPQTKF